MPSIQLLAVSVALCCSVLLHSTTGQCPKSAEFSPCTCDGEGFNCRKALNSSDLQRAFAASSETLSSRVLYLHGTPVEKLTKGIFGKYAIKEYFLDFNRIKTVERGTFNGSQSILTTISLYTNSIESFPFEDLREFKNLEVVNLGNNYLTSIPDNAFGPIPSLTQLLLLNNKISKIGSRAFDGLSRLQNLDLSQNQLRSLGPQSMAIPKSHAELSIGLSLNAIHEISPNAFLDTAPKYLLLDRNNMTIFPESSYRQLISTLFLTGGFISVERNIFTCKGCEFKWLIGNGEADQVLAGFECDKDGREIRHLSLLSIGCEN